MYAQFTLLIHSW